jgi:c(7)-type cytochrome triheme protein
MGPLSVDRAFALEDAETLQCAERLDAGKRLLPPSRGVEPSPEVIPLFYLPRDNCGYVDWAQAMREGYLAPRDSILDRKKSAREKRSPGDIVLRVKGDSMDDVVFPHDTHNEVLDCKSCHPKIFKKIAGAAPINMDKIFDGEYCGRCHGKVSFPLSNCSRCHSGINEVVRND